MCPRFRAALSENSKQLPGDAKADLLVKYEQLGFERAVNIQFGRFLRTNSFAFSDHLRNGTKEPPWAE